MVSCFTQVGADSQLKHWSLLRERRRGIEVPRHTVLLQSTPFCVDHHRTSNVLAVGMSDGVVQLFDDKGADPLQSWQWGNDAVMALRFNPIETSFFGCLMRDKSMALYDIRQSEPLRKVRERLKLNTFFPLTQDIGTARGQNPMNYRIILLLAHPPDANGASQQCARLESDRGFLLHARL